MRVKKSMAIALVCVVTLLVGAFGTYALMRSGTQSDTLNAVPAIVACEVELTESSGAVSSVRVQNTGNTDAYIRVRLVTHMENADGEIVGMSSPALTVSASASWSASNGGWYCTEAVAPGAYTPNLLAAPLMLTESQLNGVSVHQVIEALADAIQAEPADAAHEAWGVSP